MIVDVAARDVERFRAALVSRLGLVFDEQRATTLAETLRARASACGEEPVEYLTRLELRHDNDEIAVLARELTVPETYFFRSRDQLDAFVLVAVPERTSIRLREPVLRVLSLGCASGEEAYTLAMVLADALPIGWQASIVGVDVNPAVIEKARMGRYSPWALRDTPASSRERWFRPSRKEFVLDERVRAGVRFEVRNLMDEDPGFWRAERYDVIFCRNVIMYFAFEQAAALIERIRHSLVPGGYFFLGHAETLRGLSNAFHLRHTHSTFYYQRREQTDAAGSEGHWHHTGEPGPRPAAVTHAPTWVDVIRRASDRVTALTSPRTASPAAAPSDTRSRRAWDLSAALELLRQERFEEALVHVDGLPRESVEDPDVRLLRAVLLTHAGQLGEAERACAGLLETNDLSAGAHYLLALCREGAGDAAGALHHDQAAAYLDPAFAMPRLHMGLVARKAGDIALARRELSQAAILLQQEDASRLLLFGGGFGREALATLCRAELARCGERK